VGRVLAAEGGTLIGSRHAKALLLGATLTAAMVVGLLAFATSARADVVCQDQEVYCLEQTATPDPVEVGEPLTFTIRAFCTNGNCIMNSPEIGLTDTLPEGVEFVSASATGYGGPLVGNLPQPTCSESGGTVTCAPVALINSAVLGLEVPFVATIEVIPKECGTFTNTANLPLLFDQSVSQSFTVEGCVPTYDFQGFFSPVDNPDVATNKAKAGSSIPVKFSLGGDQGLDIFATGTDANNNTFTYPTSTAMTCDSTDELDAIEETVTAGGSALQYDSSLEQYTYVWKTNKAWAGSCRQLVVKLDDGTYHRANFKFVK
jgi:uncharacterized repeat protein (TIGR01451 family)